jgi:hemerythrin-like metal-binding protein
MAIQWSEEYATGNGDIDTQHRRLFDMLNSLERRINRQEAPSKMVDVIDSLTAYAKEHFCFEERCMERCACPAASINKLAHQRFLRMVDTCVMGLKSQEPTLKDFKNLHWELTDWVSNHIRKVDTSLRTTS